MTPPAEQQMSILFDLWLINHLLSDAIDDALTEAAGMTGEEFGFYSLLRRFGPVSGSQVSRWTAIRPTTLSTTVRRLQERGHVEQRPHPTDGRSRLLALTSAGEKAHATAAAAFFTATRALASALGPEEQRQRAALQRLDAALREVAGLDPRPYSLDSTHTTAGHDLPYEGPPLSPTEEADVRTYIDFVRSRRDPGATS